MTNVSKRWIVHGGAALGAALLVSMSSGQVRDWAPVEVGKSPPRLARPMFLPPHSTEYATAFPERIARSLHENLQFVSVEDARALGFGLAKVVEGQPITAEQALALVSLMQIHAGPVQAIPLERIYVQCAVRQLAQLDATDPQAIVLRNELSHLNRRIEQRPDGDRALQMEIETALVSAAHQGSEQQFAGDLGRIEAAGRLALEHPAGSPQRQEGLARAIQMANELRAQRDDYSNLPPRRLAELDALHASMLYRAGHYSDAREYYRAAGDNPAYAQAHSMKRMVANCYAREGNREAAIAELARQREAMGLTDAEVTRWAQSIDAALQAADAKSSK